MMLLQSLQHEVRQALAAYKDSFALIAVDIDFLIRYSMRLTGDQTNCLMEKVTSFLKREFHPHEFFYKHGLDEFYVICSPADNHFALKLAERVRKRFRGQRFADFFGDGFRNTRMSFSAGIAAYPENGGHDKVFEKASVSLYAAKAYRRNQAVAFNDYQPAQPPRRLYNRQAYVEVISGGPGKDGRVRAEIAAESAMLWEPQALAASDDGRIYIADQNNHQIVDYNGRTMSAVLGTGEYGAGREGQKALKWALNKPTGLCVSDDNLYVTDTGNDTVIRCHLPTQSVNRAAGSGQSGYYNGGNAADARLNKPGGIAADCRGNLYINDIANNIIRLVTPDGCISDFAGNGRFGFNGDGGDALNAAFNEIYGIGIDEANDSLYIVDYGNHRIRRVDLKTRIISTVTGCGRPGYSGDGASALDAMINCPTAVCGAEGRYIFIAESANHAIRIVDLRHGTIHTLAGGCGIGTGVNEGIADFRLANPNALAVTGNKLYFLDGANNRLCRIQNWIK
ncbi:MAG: diguanylate cyclase [Defluviitaleaceae bacterium]|nr:diguanylate cyclase [Defluviitaleaceae bacterium]